LSDRTSVVQRLRALPSRLSAAAHALVERAAARSSTIRRAVTVQRRFGDVHGGALASAITLSTFVAIFPLAVVGIAVLGLVASDPPQVTRTIVDQLGLHGAAADLVRDTVGTARSTRRAASIVGLAGLAWAGSAVVTSLTNAYDTVWGVKDRGLRERIVGFLWLLGAGAGLAVSIGASAALRWLPGWSAPLALLVSLLIDAALFLWTGWLLPNRKVSWRASIPGAVVGGFGLLVLQLVGFVVVPMLVSRSSALWGSLGAVFALLAWLAFFARLVVYAAIVDVVVWEESSGTRTVAQPAPRLEGEAAEHAVGLAS
jgi:membrane protein